MSSYRMESCIQGFHIYKEVWTPFIGERLGCAREKQQRKSVRCCNKERHWNSRPCTARNLVRLYTLPAAACVRILWSYREQQTERRLIVILVTHDVMDWLELFTCPFTVIFADEIFADGCWPAKTANFKPREIKAHTVYCMTYISYIILSLVCNRIHR